jgi:LPXTG-site transpeptidase (sortase) family protein
MKHIWMSVLFVGIVLGLSADSTSAANNNTKAPAMRLEIPSIGVHTDVVIAPQTQTSWDFSHIWWQAGWLEGTGLPGSPDNVVIGAHVDTVFAKLAELKIGSDILLTSGEAHYLYRMVNAYAVRINNMLPVSQIAWRNMLTLMTCAGVYKQGQYPLRYVVQADLIKQVD